MSNPRTGRAGFWQHEAAGGIAVMAAALIAIVLANSPLAWVPVRVFDTTWQLQVFGISHHISVLHAINDGLMAIFFLVVGLEIKRELLAGALSSRDRAVLPAIGAVGGMIVPALIYAAINAGDAKALRGWAVPSATDIAFAVAVLVLMGRRVPAALKVFLLALAILDDLGAILIIAAVYTSKLSLVALAAAAILCALLAAFNWLGVRRLAPYLLLGAALWVSVLESGVHATVAGVILALAIPLRGSPATAASPLSVLEALLAPWATFAVVPLFALANAGVSLAGFGLDRLLAPVPLGIMLGLLVGKCTGIAGAVWLAVRTGVARLPDGVTWAQFFGVALLGGIGFTMSLFIGLLAFGPDAGAATALRLGVLAGSCLSAVSGSVVLLLATRTPPAGRAGQ